MTPISFARPSKFSPRWPTACGWSTTCTKPLALKTSHCILHETGEKGQVRRGLGQSRVVGKGAPNMASIMSCKRRRRARTQNRVYVARLFGPRLAMWHRPARFRTSRPIGRGLCGSKRGQGHARHDSPRYFRLCGTFHWDFDRRIRRLFPPLVGARSSGGHGHHRPTSRVR